jgi:hypothetical protein
MKGKRGYIYRIFLSESLLSQMRNDVKGFSQECHKAHFKEFINYDKAYAYFCSTFGSANLNIWTTSLGGVIQKKKIGDNEWKFTTGA